MRALGIDYGSRRIGLALSDACGSLARPWKSVPRAGNPAQVARSIADQAASVEQDEGSIAVIVLGLPRRLNGQPSEHTATVIELADLLRSMVAVPVVLQDERLSSHEAEELLAQREKDWRKRKPLVDAMAASIILQDYLDGHPRASGGPEENDA